MAKSRHSDFDDFVKRQQPSAGVLSGTGDVAVDWNKERDEWLDHLDALYAKIGVFLKEYIDDGSIRVEFDKISLVEEDIGSYSARAMKVYIGRQEIDLTPVGTLFIGLKGRVDITGSAGRSRLLLVDKDIANPQSLFGGKPGVLRQPVEWTWKIASAPPATRFIELSKDTLFQVLMEVSNG